MRRAVVELLIKTCTGGGALMMHFFHVYKVKEVQDFFRPKGKEPWDGKCRPKSSFFHDFTGVHVVSLFWLTTNHNTNLASLF